MERLWCLWKTFGLIGFNHQTNCALFETTFYPFYNFISNAWIWTSNLKSSNTSVQIRWNSNEKTHHHHLYCFCHYRFCIQANQSYLFCAFIYLYLILYLNWHSFSNRLGLLWIDQKVQTVSSRISSLKNVMQSEGTTLKSHVFLNHLSVKEPCHLEMSIVSTCE